MKKETAKELIGMYRHYGQRLINHIPDVKKHAEGTEGIAYVRAVGRTMGDMFADVLRPLLREYPELEPEEWKPEYANIPPLENPIATRELWTRDEQGNKAPVSVLLAAPVQDPEFKYVCDYQIRGRGNNRTHSRSGEDPMQALIQAIRAIGWELRDERENKGKKIWWHDEDGTLEELGFPVPNGPHD